MDRSLPVGSRGKAAIGGMGDDGTSSPTIWSIIGSYLAEMNAYRICCHRGKKQELNLITNPTLMPMSSVQLLN